MRRGEYGFAPCPTTGIGSTADKPTTSRDIIVTTSHRRRMCMILAAFVVSGF